MLLKNNLYKLHYLNRIEITSLDNINPDLYNCMKTFLVLNVSSLNINIHSYYILKSTHKFNINEWLLFLKIVS